MLQNRNEFGNGSSGSEPDDATVDDEIPVDLDISHCDYPAPRWDAVRQCRVDCPELPQRLTDEFQLPLGGSGDRPSDEICLQ
jgi:hypothetical protein